MSNKQACVLFLCYFSIFIYRKKLNIANKAIFKWDKNWSSNSGYLYMQIRESYSYTEIFVLKFKLQNENWTVIKKVI